MIMKALFPALLLSLALALALSSPGADQTCAYHRTFKIVSL